MPNHHLTNEVLRACGSLIVFVCDAKVKSQLLEDERSEVTELEKLAGRLLKFVGEHELVFFVEERVLNVELVVKFMQ
jgi:hypothetical protein